MLLRRRSSKPPFSGWPTAPCAHSDAVDRIDVVRVGTLPKIGWMSSYGDRKRPILNVPQLPCRPTNVSRVAKPAGVPVANEEFGHAAPVESVPPPTAPVELAFCAVYVQLTVWLPPSPGMADSIWKIAE